MKPTISKKVRHQSSMLLTLVLVAATTVTTINAVFEQLDDTGSDTTATQIASK